MYPSSMNAHQFVVLQICLKSLMKFNQLCNEDFRVVSAGNCPEGMDYHFKTTACAPTCERPNAPEECNLPQVENCVCVDNDQVVYDGTCMDAELCGCVDENGHHHAVSASLMTAPNYPTVRRRLPVQDSGLADTFPFLPAIDPFLPDFTGFYAFSYDSALPSQPGSSSGVVSLRLRFGNCFGVFCFISCFHMPEPLQHSPFFDHRCWFHPCYLQYIPISDVQRKCTQRVASIATLS